MYLESRNMNSNYTDRVKKTPKTLGRDKQPTHAIFTLCGGLPTILTMTAEFMLFISNSQQIFLPEHNSNNNNHM